MNQTKYFNSSRLERVRRARSLPQRSVQSSSDSTTKSGNCHLHNELVRAHTTPRCSEISCTVRSASRSPEERSRTNTVETGGQQFAPPTSLLVSLDRNRPRARTELNCTARGSRDQSTASPQLRAAGRKGLLMAAANRQQQQQLRRQQRPQRQLQQRQPSRQGTARNCATSSG